MISKQRIYTRQFKDEAIALVLRQGYTCVQAALQARIAELEKKLRRAEMKREILKKATAYFAKENP